MPAHIIMGVDARANMLNVLISRFLKEVAGSVRGDPKTTLSRFYHLLSTYEKYELNTLLKTKGKNIESYLDKDVMKAIAQQLRSDDIKNDKDISTFLHDLLNDNYTGIKVNDFIDLLTKSVNADNTALKLLLNNCMSDDSSVVEKKCSDDISILLCCIAQSNKLRDYIPYFTRNLYMNLFNNMKHYNKLEDSYKKVNCEKVRCNYETPSSSGPPPPPNESLSLLYPPPPPDRLVTAIKLEYSPEKQEFLKFIDIKEKHKNDDIALSKEILNIYPDQFNIYEQIINDGVENEKKIEIIKDIVLNRKYKIYKPLFYYILNKLLKKKPYKQLRKEISERVELPKILIKDMEIHNFDRLDKEKPIEVPVPLREPQRSSSRQSQPQKQTQAQKQTQKQTQAQKQTQQQEEYREFLKLREDEGKLVEKYPGNNFVFYKLFSPDVMVQEKINIINAVINGDFNEGKYKIYKPWFYDTINSNPDIFKDLVDKISKDQDLSRRLEKDMEIHEISKLEMQEVDGGAGDSFIKEYPLKDAAAMVAASISEALMPTGFGSTASEPTIHAGLLVSTPVASNNSLIPLSMSGKYKASENDDLYRQLLAKLEVPRSPSTLVAFPATAVNMYGGFPEDKEMTGGSLITNIVARSDNMKNPVKQFAKLLYVLITVAKRELVKAQQNYKRDQSPDAAKELIQYNTAYHRLVQLARSKVKALRDSNREAVQEIATIQKHGLRAGMRRILYGLGPHVATMASL